MDYRAEEAKLPDPSQPTTNRGSWEQAALTNVAITEMVKRQIGMGGGRKGHSSTRTQEK